MNKTNSQQKKPQRGWVMHVATIVIMLVVSCIYCFPALQGLEVKQDDIQKADAMSHQQRMEGERTGKIPNWAQSMFSGMPGYQIVTEQPKSVFQVLRNIVNMRFLGVEHSIGVLFLYLIGFYAAMIALGLSPWLALVGALGFALGSYNIVIVQAGHITKAWAISMMAPVMAGMILSLRSAVDATLDAIVRRRRVLWGSLLFTLALTLQIAFNHIQITFYTAIGCAFIAIAYLIVAICKRRFAPFVLKGAILLVGAALAFGCNVRLLLVNEEYARYTMRGGNELTVTPADLYKDAGEAVPQNTRDGLDIGYAFSWSYGIAETYTLLVPGALGGSSVETLSHDSHFYKTFRADQAPLYWGDQPFTSGPVYFGAIIVLLALMCVVVCKGPERWYLLAASLLAILLSWGRHLPGLNEWVFEHVPFYNKFRTPSMALVLANVSMAIMAMLCLKEIVAEKDASEREAHRRRVNIALYSVGGALAALILGVMAVSGGFSYTGATDNQMAAQYGNQWDQIFSVLAADRADMLKGDSWRSLVFILLTVGVVWLYNNQKLKNRWLAVGAIGLLILVDLWPVDRRYLNDSSFVDKRKLELRRDQYDYDIDALAAKYPQEQDYRVLNLAVNTFNDSKPSAFHNQVGGYSAAKLNRYQNLIDFYISRHIHPQVLNMLNTRYIVASDGHVHRNEQALGNCWFVSSVLPVGSPDEEILSLDTLNPALTAVVDTAMYPVAATSFMADSADRIVLEPQASPSADYKKYVAHCSHDRMAVFSEIHYAPDWFAYIDGKPADYVRANFVLRAMIVPAGDHVIEFRNEAPRLHRLDNTGLVISIITLLLMAGAIFFVYYPAKKGKGEK